MGPIARRSLGALRKLLALVVRGEDEELVGVSVIGRGASHALFLPVPLWAAAPGRAAATGIGRPLPVLPGRSPTPRSRSACVGAASSSAPPSAATGHVPDERARRPATRSRAGWSGAPRAVL